MLLYPSSTLIVCSLVTCSMTPEGHIMEMARTQIMTIIRVAVDSVSFCLKGYTMHRNLPADHIRRTKVSCSPLQTVDFRGFQLIKYSALKTYIGWYDAVPTFMVLAETCKKFMSNPLANGTATATLHRFLRLKMFPLQVQSSKEGV